MRKITKSVISLLTGTALIMNGQFVLASDINIFEDGAEVTCESEVESQEFNCESYELPGFGDGNEENPIVDDEKQNIEVGTKKSDSLYGYFFYNSFWNYESKDIEIEITEYAGKDAVVTVPKKIDGMKVTLIKDGAFKGNTTMTEIHMPSVKKIGNDVFRDAINLQTINATNLEEIGSGAFQGCTSLTDVKLNNVEYVGTVAFSGCQSLERIELENAWHIEACAFQGCQSLKNIELERASDIGDSAFCECTLLERVYAPRISAIGERVFYNCRSLKNVITPNVEIYIGKEAFRGCSSLEEICMPKLDSIYEYAFEGCTNLKKFVFHKDCNYGRYSFANCVSLTELNFNSEKGDKDGLGYEIHEGAFSGCTGLTSVYINNYFIGIRAFDGCSNLKKVVFKHDEVNLADYAFYNCPLLKEVSFKKPKEEIDAYALGYVEGNGPKKVEGFTIHCTPGDKANIYAVRNEFPFTFHEYEKAVSKPATTKSQGEYRDKCTICGLYNGSVKKFPRIGKCNISNNRFFYNGEVQKPTVNIVDENGKTIPDSCYDIIYNGESVEKGKYKVTVIFKGKYSGQLSWDYEITNEHPEIIASNLTVTFGTSGKSLNAKVIGKGGKVSYKSSNPKVVAVSSSGKITAKNIGSAAITITVAKTENYPAISKKITVNVIPQKPIISKVSKGDKGKLKLTWKADKNVSGYVLYRSTSKSGTYKKIKTIKGNKTSSYTDSGLRNSKTYYYKIRSYKKVGNKNIYSNYSSVKYAKTMTPKLITNFGGEYRRNTSDYGVILDISVGTDPPFSDIPIGGVYASVSVRIRIGSGGMSCSEGYLVKQGGNYYKFSGSYFDGMSLEVISKGVIVSGKGGGSGKYKMTQHYYS